mgnify:FL=1
MIRTKDKPESVNAPVAKGDPVCTAEIIYADQVVAQVQLVAAETVELSTFLTVVNAVRNFFSLTAVKIILIAVVLCVVAYVAVFVSRANKKKKRRSGDDNG